MTELKMVDRLFPISEQYFPKAVFPQPVSPSPADATCGETHASLVWPDYMEYQICMHVSQYLNSRMRFGNSHLENR